MKTIQELNLGFSDAQNYTQRKNKNMFSSIFVKNKYLEELINPSRYFLIGEKGTGKTAYAAYLNNGEYKDCISYLKFIQTTDYEKFHTLKEAHHLEISDYTEIWKTIILMLLCKSISGKENIIKPIAKKSISDINKAIDDYYQNAFSPEILYALKMIDQSEAAVKIVSKYLEGSLSTSNAIESSETKWQMNLYYIAKQFCDVISNVKLNKNVILLIDGIDVRPPQFPYKDYIECIKGLENACWLLNTSTFSNVRDSKFQFKVVLLLRPDIFHALNLQNSTNKLRDNSVYLDWNTTYSDYLYSPLYSVGQNLLSFGQNQTVDDIWEEYFTWKKPTTKDTREYDTAFMAFLKISLSRPRDIQVILQQLQTIMIDKKMGSFQKFSQACFDSDRFQNEYSEYFMSSLQDQLSFYCSPDHFRFFKRFFDYFENASFTYEEYKINYEKFIDYLLMNVDDIPEIYNDEKDFLQLLYNCNLITAVEGDGEYFHFSYREKSLSNINPAVLIDTNTTYRFHYGIYKKTKMGRY